MTGSPSANTAHTSRASNSRGTSCAHLTDAPAKGTSASHFLPVLERARQRHVIGVLEVAAHGQAARQARDADAQRRQQAADVHRRRLALEVRVRRHDHFRDRAVAQAREQLVDLEILRADAVHRRDHAVQHVVQPVEAARALDRQDVQRLLDDADRRAVARSVAADAAGVDLRDVLADGAEDCPLLQLDDRLRERDGVVVRDAQQVVGEPLRALRPDAGQLVELFDEPRDGRGAAERRGCGQFMGVRQRVAR